MQVELTETGVPQRGVGGDAQRPLHDRRLRGAQDHGPVARGGHGTGRLAAQGRRQGQHRGRPVGARGGRRRDRRTSSRRGAVHRRRRLPLDDPMRGQRPPGQVAALAAEARNALADTVVRRGDTPLPVRTPLPVQLPEPMAAQLRAAAEQAAQQQAQQALQAEQQPQPRRSPPHAAASTGLPCSSCAPSPAASDSARNALSVRTRANRDRASTARPRTPRPAPRGRRPSRRA